MWHRNGSWTAHRMAKANPVAAKKPVKRGPGRPASRNAESLSRGEIAQRALELCRREPLQDVSIVRIATELGVTPALIHYYVGGRDRLTSGVMNAFYRQLVAKLPPPSDAWRDDVTRVFDTIYANYIQFGGVVAYVMAHNRFRLYQLVEADERDYGAEFFERVIGAVRLAGLPADRTAMYAHLLLQHVLSSAFQQASRQLPEDHQAFLVSRLRRLDAGSTPNTHFVLESFAALRGDDAFATGLGIIVEAIAREVANRGPGRPRTKARAAAAGRPDARRRAD